MIATAIEPKRGANVGRIVVDVQVSNYDDLLRSQRGEILPEQVRQATVKTLIDTGATFFCLAEDVVAQLGLPFTRIRGTHTVKGPVALKIHASAQIEVQGRTCTVEVMALPENRQALLGQIPLEILDFWVDPVNQRLVGNPEHGGEWMAEVY